MKKLIAIIFAILLLFSVSASAAESVYPSSCCPIYRWQINEDEASITVNGKFRNRTPEDQVFYVKFIFYDKAGNYLYELEEICAKLGPKREKSVGTTAVIPKYILDRTARVGAEVWTEICK